ncbi:MarR family winged helix-turn-helix transcriptional regulator [Rubinisphaera italica]|uniref:Transcriptional regulator SlyA n=1 Tax=Rubinisphaera italica TaxID=2527969 RepID=A0A5C5XQE0_9PLAN|nr:MarR family transcriptional regulator [Rubinisphaera italica]TWT64285.1 Transcriptional regulator SlyA [Rubinisphaera italica]
MSGSKQLHESCDGVGFWIVSTAHAFRQALECQLTHKGITFRQWEVLSLLSKDGEQPQSDLADKMGLEAQTLAGIIARMERDGWLQRKGCCSDRRRKLISATAKAKKIQQEMHECCELVRNQAVQGLGQKELLELKRVCELMRNNLAGDCPEPNLIPKIAETIHTQTPCKTFPLDEDTHISMDDTIAPTNSIRSRKP